MVIKNTCLLKKREEYLLVNWWTLLGQVSRWVGWLACGCVSPFLSTLSRVLPSVHAAFSPFPVRRLSLGPRQAPLGRRAGQAAWDVLSSCMGTVNGSRAPDNSSLLRGRSPFFTESGGESRRTIRCALFRSGIIWASDCWLKRHKWQSPGVKCTFSFYCDLFRTAFYEMPCFLYYCFRKGKFF